MRGVPEQQKFCQTLPKLCHALARVSRVPRVSHFKIYDEERGISKVYRLKNAPRLKEPRRGNFYRLSSAKFTANNYILGNFVMADFRSAGAKCAYISVILIELWPNNLDTRYKSTPFCTRWLANVCRNL